MNINAIAVDTLLTLTPKIGKLVSMPDHCVRRISMPEANNLLDATVEHICDFYKLDIPAYDDLAQVVIWALGYCDVLGYYKTLAFGNLAKAALLTASYPEERNGYLEAQRYMFNACQWAAMGVANGK
jgi:hypothetical protein